MRERDPLKLFLLLGLGVVLTGLGLLLVKLEAPPSGPREVVWGKQACAHCRMHVSEPAFAAQLHTTEGDVMHFDDPGCLFELLRADSPRVHALWFHHAREDRWLSRDEVGFVPTQPTPMGFGVGAVEKSQPGAWTLDEAMGHARAAHGGM